MYTKKKIESALRLGAMVFLTGIVNFYLPLNVQAQSSILVEAWYRCPGQLDRFLSNNRQEIVPYLGTEARKRDIAETLVRMFRGLYPNANVNADEIRAQAAIAIPAALNSLSQIEFVPRSSREFSVDMPNLSAILRFNNGVTESVAINSRSVCPSIRTQEELFELVALGLAYYIQRTPYFQNLGIRLSQSGSRYQYGVVAPNGSTVASGR
jgi:hypothetical protein